MEEKSKEISTAAHSLKDFVSQFGSDDIYSRIIAEELLRFLMEARKENNAPTTS